MKEQCTSRPIPDNAVRVSASKEYDVIIDKNLLEKTGEYIKTVGNPGTVVIISDDTVFGLYGETVKKSIEEAGMKVLTYVFPHGESSKTYHTVFDALEYMAENGVTRSDMIVALGGGVTGDMGGFAASVFLRGIPFVQIPTTLLAAVDSSVGGKTAVDLKAGKNLAGAFYQPSLVLCDTNTLKTLPADQFACGMGEIIKTGVLALPELFDLVEKEDAAAHIEEIIRVCVEFKRDVVMEDEFDTGARAKLNLGHTLAHAVEKLSDFKTNHGHAVAIGLVAVAKCAYITGLADHDIADRVAAVCRKYDLPTEISYEVKDLVAETLKDKKRAKQMITLVIPRDIGDTYLYKMNVSELEGFFSHIYD